MTTVSSKSSAWEGDERRTNTELRLIFEQAYVLIEPFLDPGSTWGGHAMEHLALRTVRDNFPQLSAEQAHVLVVASGRVWRERMVRGNSK